MLELPIATQPELGFEEELGRLERRSVLIPDLHRRVTRIPLAVHNAGRTDERLTRASDASRITNSPAVLPLKHHESLFLIRMDVQPHHITTSSARKTSPFDDSSVDRKVRRSPVCGESMVVPIGINGRYFGRSRRR